MGLDWAFSLKENQPELLREAERCTPDPPAAIQSDPDQQLRWWHLPQVDWPVADRQVRVVKTVRLRVAVDNNGTKKSKTSLSRESTNFYAH